MASSRARRFKLLCFRPRTETPTSPPPPPPPLSAVSCSIDQDSMKERRLFYTAMMRYCTTLYDTPLLSTMLCYATLHLSKLHSAKSDQWCRPPKLCHESSLRTCPALYGAGPPHSIVLVAASRCTELFFCNCYRFFFYYYYYYHYYHVSAHFYQKCRGYFFQQSCPENTGVFLTHDFGAIGASLLGWGVGWGGGGGIFTIMLTYTLDGSRSWSFRTAFLVA